MDVAGEVDQHHTCSENKLWLWRHLLGGTSINAYFYWCHCWYQNQMSLWMKSLKSHWVSWMARYLAVVMETIFIGEGGGREWGGIETLFICIASLCTW